MTGDFKSKLIRLWWVSVVLSRPPAATSFPSQSTLLLCGLGALPGKKQETKKNKKIAKPSSWGKLGDLLGYLGSRAQTSRTFRNQFRGPPEGGVISVQCRRSACLFWAEAPWGQAGPDSTCEYPKILPKTDGGRHVPDSLSTSDRTWTTQSQDLGHIVRCSNSNCCYVVHSLNSKASLPQTLQ